MVASSSDDSPKEITLTEADLFELGDNMERIDELKSCELDRASATSGGAGSSSDTRSGDTDRDVLVEEAIEASLFRGGFEADISRIFLPRLFRTLARKADKVAISVRVFPVPGGPIAKVSSQYS